MLRQVASRLGSSFVRSIATTAARLEGEAAPAGVKEFTEAWAKTAPSTLSLPELPTNFLPPEASGEAAVDGDRFSVNFYTPHGLVAQSKVRDLHLSDHPAAAVNQEALWIQGLLHCTQFVLVVLSQVVLSQDVKAMGGSRVAAIAAAHAVQQLVPLCNALFGIRACTCTFLGLTLFAVPDRAT